MAGDVGQRFLGDPVEDQLGVAAELRQAGLHVHVDVEPGVLGDALAEHEQRAREPEVVERLRPQPARDPAHLLEAPARGLLRLQDALAGAVGHVAGDAAELQHHAGQRLADAVVELLGDAQPLALLGGERAADAVAPLGLEALEHLVERGAQLGGLGVAAADLQPPARLQQVDAPGERGQLAQRRERAAQQQQVEREHQHEAAGEDRQLAHGDVLDARREHERGDRARGREHGGVADGHAPEERGTARASEHGRSVCTGFGRHRHADRSVLEGVWPRARRQ